MSAPYEGWAILELMGHRQRVGRISEVEAYGGKLLRIDIPAEGGDVTEFYGASSVYSMRPITEEIARDAAKRAGDIRPVRPVEYRIADQTGDPSHQRPVDEYSDFGDDEGRRLGNDLSQLASKHGLQGCVLISFQGDRVGVNSSADDPLVLRAMTELGDRVLAKIDDGELDPTVAFG